MREAARRPKIVAMILAYNCAPLLRRALHQIPRDVVDEIFVTDDGSSDGSYDAAIRLGLKAYRYASSAESVGP